MQVYRQVSKLKVGDMTFVYDDSWEVSSIQPASTPQYFVLGLKTRNIHRIVRQIELHESDIIELDVDTQIRSIQNS